ncbi:MAG: hypothetical protein WAU53_18505 [Rhodoplanes sp.]
MTAVVRRPIVLSAADVATMREIERFIVGYDGDNLLHLQFPGASFRAVYLALMRTRDPARWLDPEGSA